MRPKPRSAVYVVRTSPTLPEFHADTRSEAKKKAKAWCTSWAHPPVIEAIEIAPDGHYVIEGPIIGGDWGRRCGSTCWIDDPDYRMSFIQEPPIRYEKTQRWHANRRSGTPWMSRHDEDALHGFRVICEQQMGHEGDCTAGVFSWPGSALTEEIIENRFRRTGKHQAQLELA